MSRLLIMACSQRKNPAKRMLPALVRYDGPTFRVLKKYLREESAQDLSVLILSAKFGLISADHEIPYYDCRLKTVSAKRIRPQTLEMAEYNLKRLNPTAVGICVGRDYLESLSGFADCVSKDIRIDYLLGGQGPRLTALKKWLRQNT